MPVPAPLFAASTMFFFFFFFFFFFSPFFPFFFHATFGGNRLPAPTPKTATACSSRTGGQHHCW